MTINEKFASLFTKDKIAVTETQLSEVIKETEQVIVKRSISVPAPDSFSFGGDGGAYSNFGPMPIVNGVYNGEKTKGELGNPMNLLPDHRALRFRAYEANLTNDVIKIITGKFFKWVIGNGLKMQSEPYESILRLEGVLAKGATLEDFKNNVEEYFELYSSSCRGDYSEMETLHVNAQKSFETAFLGGDCVVVLRLDDNKNLTTQIIDGQHINTPVLKNEDQERATANGWTILNGIELDKKGKHIAYYIDLYIFQGTTTGVLAEYERVECWGKDSGLRMAWMVYGMKHRIDHHRGIPMISAILEKVKKLDRFTEASVARAEEISKVAMFVEHGRTSTGENPMLQNVRNNTGVTTGPDSYTLAGPITQQISKSQEKDVYNLPVDSTLKALYNQGEITYEPFFNAIFIQLCAAVDIPPEVALQKYNSNYSASRAAINGWGFIIDIYRKKLARDFYDKVYSAWLYVHILKNKVDAPGYIEARNNKNSDVIEAYSSAKFTGTNMPHIDPMKEINAMRAALGEKFANIPLISNEQAAELLGYGDFYANLSKFNNELAAVDKTDIDIEEPQTGAQQNQPPGDE